MPANKKPLVGPPKSLSNASQDQIRAGAKRLADLKSGRAGTQPVKKDKPADKPPARSIFGAAKVLKGAAKR